MKEFKEIVDGIAHSLNLTVDSLVKIYPQLRTEYSWYYLCDTLQLIFGFSLVVLLVVDGIFAFPPFIIDSPDDESYKQALKFLKWSLVISVVLLIVLLVATVGKGFMCPDILIIEKFIK